MTNKSDGAQDADGDKEDGGDEFEDAPNRDAGEAEGERDQPDDRVEEERGEGDRPAENEQDAEEEELDHGGPFGGRVLPDAAVKKRIRG